MNAFLQALVFLTRIPVRFRPQAGEWPKSTCYYPLVGLLIGFILILFATAVSFLVPPLVCASLILVGWVWLTGGLHLDGLMDTADGIGSSREREQMLRIMKDSRVGASGVLAAVLLLLVKWAALAELVDHVRTAHATEAFRLVFIPMLARTALLLAMKGWPYLHAQGMASGLIEGLSLPRLAAAFAYSLVILFALTGPIAGLVMLLAAAAVSIAFNRSMVRRLGGLTGDTYGAVTELTETALVLVSVAWLSAGGEFRW